MNAFEEMVAEKIFEQLVKQTALLERIAVAVEKIADNGGDTQPIDVAEIKRIVRREMSVVIGGGA